MKQLQPITDPVFVGKFQYSFLERLFLGLIRDERDLPFVQLTAKISILLLPLAVLLYVPAIQGWVWWAIALAYAYFNNFVFKGPFGLMLHCTSHRVLFKKKVGYLNHYLPWVIAPFFGHSPETYYAHHIGMHHAENNLQEDESSTMPYQRDSLKAFGLYFVQFLFTGVYHLALYFFRKNRRKLLYRSVRGELLFIAFCILLAIINFKATLWVFILPFLLYRLIAMMGNWAQHAFIDPLDPGNPYKNSVTCINTRYNHKCWNDGYHISHHERQNLHWTEHPAYFLKTLDRYVVNEAVVFDNIHFLHIFIWLMCKRYDLLARHFVNIGNRFATEDEVIAFLKTRTKKFSVPQQSLAPA